jgi:hypothetical protein
VLDLKAVEDIDLEKLAILRGMCTLIKNQESTVAELFPVKEKDPKKKADKATTAAEDAIKKAQDKANGKTTGEMPT